MTPAPGFRTNFGSIDRGVIPISTGGWVSSDVKLRQCYENTSVILFGWYGRTLPLFLTETPLISLLFESYLDWVASSSHKIIIHKLFVEILGLHIAKYILNSSIAYPNFFFFFLCTLVLLSMNHVIIPNTI